MKGLTKRRKKNKTLTKRTQWLIAISSIIGGLIIWHLASTFSNVGAVLVDPVTVFRAFFTEIQGPALQNDIRMSMTRIFQGYLMALGFALPVGFLMGWYRIIRLIVEPWIQFLRCIPPIALIPLVIILLGIREPARISIIFITSFLVMVIAIFQGVTSVDNIMIKAARTLGARDMEIFFTIVVPASFPYILVAMRLGLSTALSSLIASELTGTNVGLGNMIMVASLHFNMTRVILGIVIIGIIGLIFDKVILFIDKKLTSWQEVRRV